MAMLLPILVEGIIRNISVKLFKFEELLVKKMSFKDISHLELWWPLCAMEWNHLCNFGRKHYE